MPTTGASARQIRPFKSPARFLQGRVFVAFVKKVEVGLAKLGRCIIVEKRQEGKPSSLGYGGNGMKQGARENNGAPDGRAKTLLPILRERKCTALEFIIEVDRNSKTPMGGSLRGVVAMGSEVAVIFRRVAGHYVTLHPSGIEVVHLDYFRGDTAPNSNFNGLYERGVRNDAIPPPLVGKVVNQSCLAGHVPHEARFFASLVFL